LARIATNFNTRKWNIENGTYGEWKVGLIFRNVKAVDTNWNCLWLN